MRQRSENKNNTNDVTDATSTGGEEGGWLVRKPIFSPPVGLYLPTPMPQTQSLLTPVDTLDPKQYILHNPDDVSIT